MKQREMTYADTVVMKVLNHIDQMYPAMWENVPKIARKSIENTILNALAAHSHIESGDPATAAKDARK